VTNGPRTEHPVELSTWNVQEYEIEDGDGDKAVILFRPLTHGWRTRHLEISLNLQRAAEAAGALKGDSGGDEEAQPSSEQLEILLKAQSDAESSISQFRKHLFGDLVVGCRNLTINGNEPSREELVEAILMLEDLAEGLSNHILRLGQVSEDEGKD